MCPCSSIPVPRLENTLVTWTEIESRDPVQRLAIFSLLYAAFHHWSLMVSPMNTPFEDPHQLTVDLLTQSPAETFEFFETFRVVSNFGRYPILQNPGNTLVSGRESLMLLDVYELTCCCCPRPATTMPFDVRSCREFS